jgi:flagellar biosynthesis protein FlhA
VEGTETREPAFGLPAWWIPQSRREQAAADGYTVVDPTTALVTHLSEVVRSFLPDLLTRQQTKEIVDRVGQSSPKLVEELVPKVVSLGDIQRVLRQLLRERVPARDVVTILEAIADAAAGTKDPDLITEAVRTAIGRTICRPYQTERGELPAISLSPALEAKLAGAIVRTDSGAVLAIEPAMAQKLASRMAEAIAAAVAQPVLLCAPTLRPHLARLFARALPSMGVISHSEVPPQVRVASVAVLD